jgi:hypothetical protein
MQSNSARALQVRDVVGRVLPADEAGAAVRRSRAGRSESAVARSATGAGRRRCATAGALRGGSAGTGRSLSATTGVLRRRSAGVVRRSAVIVIAALRSIVHRYLMTAGAGGFERAAMVPTSSENEIRTQELRVTPTDDVRQNAFVVLVRLGSDQASDREDAQSVRDAQGTFG